MTKKSNTSRISNKYKKNRRKLNKSRSRTSKSKLNISRNSNIWIKNKKIWLISGLSLIFVAGITTSITVPLVLSNKKENNAPIISSPDNVINLNGFKFDKLNNEIIGMASDYSEYEFFKNGDLNIPSQIKDFSIESIKENAFDSIKSEIVKIDFTNNNKIQTIPSKLFENASNLTTLNFSNSIKTINNNAFKNCSKLTSIILPTSLVTIGNSAFENCTKATNSLTIPQTVTSIGSSAFKNSRFTGKLTLSNKLKTISNSAFENCTNLSGAITLPTSITSIGTNAFKNCNKITGTFTVPNTLTSIGSSAFYGCSLLSGELSLPNSLKTIGSNAFYSNAFSTIEIHDNNKLYTNRTQWSGGFNGLIKNKDEVIYEQFTINSSGVLTITPNWVTSTAGIEWAKTGNLVIPTKVGSTTVKSLASGTT
ncbi:MAG: leucine-rich repeat domain-containing protein, partial [Mycoplasma sp.]